MQCLWCKSDSSCKAYPTSKVLPPKSLCALDEARWGVCWCQYFLFTSTFVYLLEMIWDFFFFGWSLHALVFIHLMLNITGTNNNGNKNHHLHQCLPSTLPPNLTHPIPQEREAGGTKPTCKYHLCMMLTFYLIFYLHERCGCLRSTILPQ